VSIALATKGRLWPVGGGIVIHEQFVDIQSTITDPWAVTMEMEEVQEITVQVADSPEITASVEVLESVTGEPQIEADVSGDIEEC
jgi:hypothetical protein